MLVPKYLCLSTASHPRFDLSRSDSTLPCLYTGLINPISPSAMTMKANAISNDFTSAPSQWTVTFRGLTSMHLRRLLTYLGHFL